MFDEIGANLMFCYKCANYCTCVPTEEGCFQPTRWLRIDRFHMECTPRALHQDPNTLYSICGWDLCTPVQSSETFTVKSGLMGLIGLAHVIGLKCAFCASIGRYEPRHWHKRYTHPQIYSSSYSPSLLSFILVTSSWTMSSIFCCPNTQPYKDHTLSHESKLQLFKLWASYPNESSITEDLLSTADVTFAVRVVKQTNFGPVESKRYCHYRRWRFFRSDRAVAHRCKLPKAEYVSILKREHKEHKCWYKCRFKNYKCTTHNKFLDTNIYQKDPVNAYHWLANIATPATEIDLWEAQDTACDHRTTSWLSSSNRSSTT
jgi:hypothetical protein